MSKKENQQYSIPWFYIIADGIMGGNLGETSIVILITILLHNFVASNTTRPNSYANVPTI